MKGFSNDSSQHHTLLQVTSLRPNYIRKGRGGFPQIQHPLFQTFAKVHYFHVGYILDLELALVKSSTVLRPYDGSDGLLL